MSRYDINTLEGEFQPGSDQRVLRNLQGISSLEDMNELEFELLAQLYEGVLFDDLPDRTLTVDDLKAWHRRWLGNVYPWAGRERGANLSKGGFAFAAAGQIPRLLTQFERDCLQRWTPCHAMSQEQLVEAVAVTHVELILIPPFREGNGPGLRTHEALRPQRAGPQRRTPHVANLMWANRRFSGCLSFCSSCSMF